MVNGGKLRAIMSENGENRQPTHIRVTGLGPSKRVLAPDNNPTLVTDF